MTRGGLLSVTNLFIEYDAAIYNNPVGGPQRNRLSNVSRWYRSEICGLTNCERTSDAVNCLMRMGRDHLQCLWSSDLCRNHKKRGDFEWIASAHLVERVLQFVRSDRYDDTGLLQPVDRCDGAGRVG